MASFASDVKKELTNLQVSVKEARAELMALVRMNGVISVSEHQVVTLDITTENAAIARRIYSSLKMVYLIAPEVLVRRKMKLKKNNVYVVRVKDHVNELLCDMAIDFMGTIQPDTFQAIATDDASKRAYLRGAFMAGGSVNNPETSSYHLEIYSVHEGHNEAIQVLMNDYGFHARMAERRKGYLVYLKEADKISDFLALIGASQAILRFENVRVTRDMRNSINRRVNCENANLTKTVNAAMQQIENIEFIQSTIGLEKLPVKLQEVATVRLNHPDLSLKQLGELIPNGPVSKSGVNHRLRKINQYADALRKAE
ncbi:MAG: DNA-binding protein WhiA [Aerococcus sp.]|nr:DNA-binding protein WhiA [Aerococcus sp.]